MILVLQGTMFAESLDSRRFGRYPQVETIERRLNFLNSAAFLRGPPIYRINVWRVLPISSSVSRVGVYLRTIPARQTNMRGGVFEPPYRSTDAVLMTIGTVPTSEYTAFQTLSIIIFSRARSRSSS